MKSGFKYPEYAPYGRYTEGSAYVLENKNYIRVMVYKGSFDKRGLGRCFTFKVIADNDPLPLKSRRRNLLFKSYTPALIYIKRLDPKDYPLYVSLSNCYKEFESLFKAA